VDGSMRKEGQESSNAATLDADDLESRREIPSW